MIIYALNYGVKNITLHKIMKLFTYCHTIVFLPNISNDKFICVAISHLTLHTEQLKATFAESAIAGRYALRRFLVR